MDLSIVIPLYNEGESIIELNSSIYNILSKSDVKFELIYVDDGSTDNSWKNLIDISKNQSLYVLDVIKSSASIVQEYSAIGA